MALTTVAAEVYRDFALDGVPSSEVHEPKKSDIRRLLGGYEQVINAFTSNGGLIYSIKSGLDADLSKPANTMAWVLGDPVAANNGIYEKLAGPGAGSWARRGDLPYSFIVASDVGAGTPNAIQATSSLPIFSSALVLLNVYEVNTGSPVTVSFNGGSPLTIKTNSGNDVDAGGLVSGALLLGRVSGSTFRLVSDQASSALLAQMETILDQVEIVRDEVLGAVPNVFSPTKASLKALDTNQVGFVYLSEPGREGQFIWRAGDYSGQVAADTTEGIYIKADAVAATSGAWVRQFVGLADVRWFGALLNDAADDTMAFSKALSVAKDVFFPEGRAYITDMIQVPNNGNLIGEGVGRSILSIKSDFNLSAECVVKMGTSENMSFIDKIGFECEQPATGVRADMHQYPWMIGHRNIPRVRIGHVRFSRAYYGIDASQNAGGATYDWIESGTLRTALKIDGALDTMNLGRFRVWPFGIGSSGDGGTGDVYRDGANIGLDIGRCDGMAGEVHMFRATATFRASGVGSASRHLTSLHLDGDGAILTVEDGPLDIDFLYSTKTGSPTVSSVLLAGSGNPDVTIGNFDLLTSASAQPSVQVNTGKLVINGGKVDHRALGKEALYVQGTGVLILRNTELTALGGRTSPYVVNASSTASLIVQDCWFPNNGGTGAGVTLLGASTGDRISGVKWNGRKLLVDTASVGSIDVSFSGYVSADATTTVRLLTGWSVSKLGTGNYSITHNLGWTLSRQVVMAMVQNNAADGSVVVDQTNTTTNVLRLRTFSGGAAADLPFTFTLAHS